MSMSLFTRPSAPEELVAALEESPAPLPLGDERPVIALGCGSAAAAAFLAGLVRRAGRLGSEQAGLVALEPRMLQWLHV